MLAPCTRWGIYEKALPRDLAWDERLAAAARAGYQFVEMSIDESDERLERLAWTPRRRRELRETFAGAPASVDTLCLSANRRFPLGSASADVRRRGFDIMRCAIDFAAEMGIRIVQVAGYDVFYEDSTEASRERYREGIVQTATWASERSVMLGLENVDCAVVDSVEKALAFVAAADTPWFQVYPDVGNLCGLGKDMCAEIRLGAEHIVAVHVKDTRVGQLRGVPLGSGIVDFSAAFRALGAIGYRGPLVVEMWNEAAPHAEQTAAAARLLLARALEASRRGQAQD